LVLVLPLRPKTEHEGTCTHVQLGIPHILGWLRRPPAHDYVSSLLKQWRPALSTVSVFKLGEREEANLMSAAKSDSCIIFLDTVSAILRPSEH
jgi:hypothetical protein